MAGTAVATLVSVILEEGNFDATPAMALRWLDQRHKLICSRSKCFRRRLPIAGGTVAGTRGYPIPAEVVEIREVTVQGSASVGGSPVPYGAGRTTDLAAGALGFIWLGGQYVGVGGGIYVRDESNAGQDLLALYPTPSESGLAIELLAVCRPPALENGGEGAGATLVTPVEFDDALVAGAISTGLSRIESREDLAAGGESKFAAACEELTRQVNKRMRGAGAAQIRVIGYNA